MIRTTHKPLTTCCKPGRPHCRSARAPRSAVASPALWGRGFLLVALVLTSLTVVAAPTIETRPPPDQVLLELPPSMPSLPAAATPAQRAERVQHWLTLANTEDDPRFLGYAQRSLERWPAQARSTLYQLLWAQLEQRLHRFEPATERLRQVQEQTRAGHPHWHQATLMLATLALVQGDYPQARQACTTLVSARSDAGLAGLTCQALVMARTGQSDTAYKQLTHHLEQARQAPLQARLWARSVLADLAAQRGDPAAESHWQWLLLQAPDLHQSRAEWSDWLLARGRHQQVLTLTAHHQDSDRLALLRLLALQQSSSTTETQHLRQQLAQRFRDARWRGELLHRRTYARYLLDVERDTGGALNQARLNWQHQREPEDTRLLLRAAYQHQDQDTLRQVKDWLATNQQSDARYPEGGR